MVTSEARLNPDDLEYAGFWIRALASLIDTVILGLILAPIIYWFGHAVPMPYYSHYVYFEISGGWDFIATKLLPAAYAVSFWHFRSATPGKSILGLSVLDARSGKAPSLWQAIGRYLAYFLSAIGFFLGFIWIAFDSRKQGWHDKLAGTVVVRAKRPGTQAVRFS